MSFSVLVIDDETELADLICEQLIEHFNCKAMAAYGYHEALKACFEHGSFDLVVCDYSMPDGTGLDFFLLGKEKNYFGKFIIFSGNLSELKEDSQDFVLISKPDTQKLIENVARTFS